MSQSTAAIIDGALDEATSGVVFVMPAICTGTLIAPNLVLTAQHCVAPLDNEPEGEIVGCYPSVLEAALPPGLFSVHTGSPTGDDGSPRHDVAVVVVPTPSTPVNQICGHDMALLILDAPVPDHEATPVVPRVDVPLAAGEWFSVVGYGQLDEQTEIDPEAATRYRRDDLTVECVGDGCSSLPGYVVSSEWRGNGATCDGDSGGPALDAEGRVVGVDSRNNGCGSYSLFGGIYQHAEWIRTTAMDAATFGGYAPPAWSTGWPTDPAYAYPVGDPCETATDCASGRCLDAVCTRLCNPAAPCPEEFECDASTSLCAPLVEPVSSSPEPPSQDAERETSGCSLARRGQARTVLDDGAIAIAIAASALLGLRLRRRSARRELAGRRSSR